MERKQIPFRAMSPSVEAMLGGAPYAHNVVFDPAGAIRCRPALASPVTAPSAALSSKEITGIYITNDDTILAIDASRRIYRSEGLDFEPLSNVGDTASYLAGKARPSFAEAESIVAICAGLDIQAYEKATGNTYRLSPDAPHATSVAAISSRLIANSADSRSQFFFSEPVANLAVPSVWPADNFITAEARPDPIVALGESTNELWVWGKTSCQIFVPDAANIFVPVRTTEAGLRSASSVVKVDQTFFWLDHDKRFVSGAASGFDTISTEVQGLIDNLSDPDSCWGVHLRQGTTDGILWTFPTDGVSLFHQQGFGWTTWFASTQSGARALPISCAAQRRSKKVMVVGTKDGRLLELSNSSSSDFGYERINARVSAGMRSHGGRVMCHRVEVVMRRTSPSSTREDVGFIRFRDSLGQGYRSLPISMPPEAKDSHSVVFRGLGSYDAREWVLDISPASPVSIAGVYETVSPVADIK